eukprot:TRINITY_DN67931_c7_g1_i12.p1 TRINITY_DN67931_c7_g1~~TRINITY_DN67931_c7_g1_i12.p1  ORF type:complete len:840 (+),score=36.14 TRINITY_DN67931_c7_g1_i12:37-2556(+)
MFWNSITRNENSKCGKEMEECLNPVWNKNKKKKKPAADNRKCSYLISAVPSLKLPATAVDSISSAHLPAINSDAVVLDMKKRFFRVNAADGKQSRATTPTTLLSLSPPPSRGMPGTELTHYLDMVDDSPNHASPRTNASPRAPSPKNGQRPTMAITITAAGTMNSTNTPSCGTPQTPFHAFGKQKSSTMFGVSGFFSEDSEQLSRAAMVQWEQQKAREKEIEARRQQQADRLVSRKQQEIEDLKISWLRVVHITRGWQRVAQLHHTRKARRVLQAFFVPRWRLRFQKRKARMQRRWLTCVYKSTMERPTPQTLKKTSFFNKWPLGVLVRVSRLLQPRAYLRGEVIAFEGDAGLHMYILDNGQVGISVRRKGENSKSRDIKTGIHIATLKGYGIHFGEFSLLSDEPRMATLYCVERVCLWQLTRFDLFWCMETLPPHIKAEVSKNADDRRRENMWKLYQLSVHSLRMNAVFNDWPSEPLQELIENFTAHVYKEDDQIIHQGDIGEGVYFVARGKVGLYHDKGDGNRVLQCAVTAPYMFGEEAVLFLETQPFGAAAITKCEVWRLPKKAFHNVLMKNPQRFIKAKKIININRAKRLPVVPIRSLKRSGMFPDGTTAETVLKKFQSMMFSRVYDRTDTLVSVATPQNEMLFIQNGSVQRSDGPIIPAGRFIGTPQSLNSKADGQWSHSYKALERADVWVVMKKDFQTFLEEVPEDVQRAILIGQALPTNLKKLNSFRRRSLLAVVQQQVAATQKEREPADAETQSASTNQKSKLTKDNLQKAQTQQKATQRQQSNAGPPKIRKPQEVDIETNWKLSATAKHLVRGVAGSSKAGAKLPVEFSR